MLIICFVLFAILIIIVSASLGAFSFANINQMLIVFKRFSSMYKIRFLHKVLSINKHLNSTHAPKIPKIQKVMLRMCEKHHFIFEACFGEVCWEEFRI